MSEYGSAGLAAALAIVAGAAHAAPLQRPVAASFALSVSSPGQPDIVSRGHLVLLPAGRACVRVQAPLRQEMWLTADGATLYYPDRGVRLKLGAAAHQVPPTLDAVVAALADPIAALPKGSTLLSQSKEGAAATSVWKVAAAGLGNGGTIAVTEQPEGLSALVIRDEKGLLAKRYAFSGRRGAQLPGVITAEHFAHDGTLSRRELWQLQQAAVAPQGRAGCAEPASGVAVRDVNL